MAETSVDSRLEDLKRLINCAANLMLVKKEEICFLHPELRTLRSILLRMASEHENVEILVTQIRGVTSKVEAMKAIFRSDMDAELHPQRPLSYLNKSELFFPHVISCMCILMAFFSCFLFSDFTHFPMGSSILLLLLSFFLRSWKNARLNDNQEAMKAIALEVMDIFDKICDIRVQQAGKPSDGGPSRVNNKQLEAVSMAGMAETAVDSRFENLKRLINSMGNLILDEEDQIRSFYKWLVILPTILKIMEKKCYEYENVENLLTQIGLVASKVEGIKAKLELPPLGQPSFLEKIIWLLIVFGCKVFGSSSKLNGAQEEIKAIALEVVGIYNKICDIRVQQAGKPSGGGPSRAENKQLEAVSIIGVAETAVDSCLENLKRLINCAVNLIVDEKDQIRSFYKGLVIQTSILKIMEKKCYEHENVENLVAQIRLVASKVEVMKAKIQLPLPGRSSYLDKIKCFLMIVFGCKVFGSSLNLNGVIEDIKAIMVEVMAIYDKLCDIRVLQAGRPSDGGPSRSNSAIINDEIFVGFEDEALTIKDQLTGGKKQLEIVSIVGMPGLGKTTLARKMYNDPYIRYHFNIQAWAYVSQVYRKRALLLEILQSLIDLTVEIKEMTVEKLGERLYKSLKGKRYLIVMDDIWSIGAWDDIRVYLPNDNNGSKVLFTSRQTEVALHAKPDSHPHCLRFLTEEESWELLHEKLFQKENCPPELLEIGKQITRKCEGLPLAIVVIAGLLAKNEKTEDWWKHVAGSVSSYIVSDPNQYMNTLALSYDHLPRHLKRCFLYLGAFRDDREIPVWKLILLWVAEGFIQKVGQKRLEDIAEDYLMDLIDRNLVIVARKRSNGGIKTCRMHDLLRDLCLKKAEEFNFLERSQHVSLSSSNNRANNQHRLCIHSDFLNFDGISETEPYAPLIQSFNSYVLNFDSISIDPSAPVVRSFLCFDKLDRTPLNFNPTFMDTYAFVYSFFLRLRTKDVRMTYLRDVFRCRDDRGESEELLFRKKCRLFVDGYSFLKGSDPSMWLSLFVGRFSFLKDTDPCLYSFMLLQHSRNKYPHGPWLLNYQTLKLLRVLDLWCPNVFFSVKILQLVHLRYLAIQTDDFYVLPPSISNLSNLETLILGTRSSHVILPCAIQKMGKLRHLYSKGGQYHIDFHCPKVVPLFIDGDSFMLENLQTVSDLCPCGHVQDFLARTPNLRKLGFRGHLISKSGHLKFPDLCLLTHLETLRLDNWAPVQSSDLQQVMLPASLKSLTLRGTRIKWEEMWIVGMLPYLEVLKLEINACQGPQWETIDGGFHRLKFLKFKLLAVERWITPSTSFPSLQHLVLENCVLFDEIPSSLGDIFTLRVMEVKFCSPSADDSARKIKKEQERLGNNELKILIDNQECSGIADEAESSEIGSEEE